MPRAPLLSKVPAKGGHDKVLNESICFEVSIVDNILSDEIDGKVHPSLDTFGHYGVFEVASVEEPMITWRLKFFKKGLAKEKIL